MNASKLLVSTAAAIAVVGSIGFAYAQSTDANATAPITPGQTQAEPVAPSTTPPVPPSLQDKPAATGAVPSGPVSDMPATTAAPVPPADAAPTQPPLSTDTMPAERAPQADRN